MSENKFIPEVFVVQGSSADLEARDGCDTEKQGGPDTGGLQESDGFIPVTELTLDKLPEPIRSTDSLDTILDVAKHVVAINNNGTSSERPPNFQLGKTLKGTGFIFFIAEEQSTAAEDKKKEHLAVVSTNKHVLFNDEEVKNATIDIFYDEPMAAACKSGRIRRTARGKGLGTLRSNQEDDFTLAVFLFSDKVMAHIADPTFTREKFPVLLHQLQTPTSVVVTSQESVVCVISHPLGQPKKVSFGQLLEQDVAKRSLTHNAATRVGSSGAPLLIFSPAPQAVPANSIWYHTRVDSTTQTKAGGLQVNDSRLFEITQSVMDEATERYTPSFLVQFMRETTINPEETISNVYGVVKNNTLIEAVASNVSFLSCLGSLVLQPDTFLPSLCLDDLHPCQPLEESEMRAAVEQGGEDASNAVKVLRTASPGLLPSDLEQSLDPGLLSQFLLDQGPCYCHHVFAALKSRLDNTAGEDDSLCFLHPLSTPVNASQQRSWPFLSGKERLSCRVPHGCIGKILIKRLAESPLRVVEYMSYLPSLLVLMEASKIVRERAESKSCSSTEPSERAEALGMRELSNKQQSVLKLLVFFVPWGLKLSVCFAGAVLTQCTFNSRLVPLALTPPWTEDDDTDGEPDNSSQPSQRRLVTFEDLQAMDNTSQLLKHVTGHLSQTQRIAPKAAAASSCSCRRPQLADLVDAADHLQTLLQSRSAKEMQAKAEATQPDCSATVAKDESDASLQQAKVPDSEQGKSATEQIQVKRKRHEQVIYLRKAFNVAMMAAQTKSAGGNQLSDHRINEQSTIIDEKSKTGGDHPGAKNEEGSKQDDAALGSNRKDKSSDLNDVEVDLPGARPAQPKSSEEDAGKDVKERPDAPQDHNRTTKAENKDSENLRRDPNKTGKHYEEITLKSESSGGYTHKIAPEPLSCATNAAGGTGQRAHIPTSDLPLTSSRPSDGDSGTTQTSTTDLDRKHLPVHDGGADSDKNQKNITEGGDNGGRQKRHDLDDLNKSTSEGMFAAFAALSTTLHVMSKKPTPAYLKTVRTSLREARLARQLAERYRVALLETPVSFSDTLSAMEVLHYNCPRFLALCHRVLGCSCDSHAAVFPQHFPCQTPAENVDGRPVTQQTGAGTSTRGSEKNHDDMLGDWQQKSTPLVAEGSETKEQCSQTLVARGLVAATNSSSDEKFCSEQTSAPNNSEASGEKEQSKAKTERVDLSVEALKAQLKEAIEKNPEDDNLRVLMDEGYLQAFSDMLVFAESERIPPARVQASYNAALLVLAHDCRDAMRPPEGLDAFALKLAERFFDLLGQQRTKPSKQ